MNNNKPRICSLIQWKTHVEAVETCTRLGRLPPSLSPILFSFFFFDSWTEGSVRALRFLASPWWDLRVFGERLICMCLQHSVSRGAFLKHRSPSMPSLGLVGAEPVQGRIERGKSAGPNRAPWREWDFYSRRGSSSERPGAMTLHQRRKFIRRVSQRSVSCHVCWPTLFGVGEKRKKKRERKRQPRDAETVWFMLVSGLRES